MLVTVVDCSAHKQGLLTALGRLVSIKKAPKTGGYAFERFFAYVMHSATPNTNAVSNISKQYIWLTCKNKNKYDTLS